MVKPAYRDSLDHISLVDALRRELDAFARALDAAVPRDAEPSPEAVEALPAVGYLD